MPFARRESVASLIGDLMGQLGLAVPGVFVGNSEETCAQFVRLANSAGQQLAMGDFKWQALGAEFTITTVVDQAEYDLPEDFDGFVADSQWNRTTRLPVLGSLREYEWQMLKARLLAGTTFTALFRIEDDQVVFYEAPTSVQEIVMPYTSRGWLRDATVPATRMDQIVADTDIVLFDPQLFKAKLKCLWYEVKGFDTAKVDRAYQRIEAAAKANDTPGRTLSLAGGGDYPYLGIINVPDTNYGS